MPELAGDLVVSLAERGACKDLVGFTCGPGTLHPNAEAAVNSIIALYCDPADPRRSHLELLIGREVPPGTLVGVAGFERGPVAIKHPRYDPREYLDAAYVAVVGVDSAYRDGTDPYVSRKGERLGDALLSGLLQHIQSAWGGRMPWVLTLIDSTNRSGVELFARFGFKKYLGLGRGHESLYRRPADLAL